MGEFKAAWYLIYTRPKQEKRLVKDLLEMGMDVYLPLINQERKWHDRVKVIEAPVFPSYVFIRLLNASHFFEASKAFGFVCYVKFGKQVATVRDSVIENMKVLLFKDAEIEVCSNYLPPGEKIVMPSGPFAGMECEIIEYNGKNKVLVRVDILNRSILVNVPIEILSVA